MFFWGGFLGFGMFFVFVFLIRGVGVLGFGGFWSFEMFFVLCFVFLGVWLVCFEMFCVVFEGGALEVAILGGLWIFFEFFWCFGRTCGKDFCFTVEVLKDGLGSCFFFFVWCLESLGRQGHFGNCLGTV